ncbi:MAG: hypothetical protein JWO25_3260 [Alphaproteobacteria bacterium]|nr:hypothetical protein [Alphaproteobacteria bacterium]
MADISQVKEHMEVIGADGVHIGTVDHVDGDRIRLTKRDSGSHANHHHYLSAGLIAGIEDDKVRLSANGDAAILLEEEKGGQAISDSGFNWKTVGIGAAAAAGVAAAGVAGAAILRSRKKSSGATGAKPSGAKTGTARPRAPKSGAPKRK